MTGGVLYETDAVRLRQARRLVATGVSPREMDKYRLQLQTHIVSCMGNLLRKPNDFLSHLREYGVCSAFTLTLM